MSITACVAVHIISLLVLMFVAVYIISYLSTKSTLLDNGTYMHVYNGYGKLEACLTLIDI